MVGILIAFFVLVLGWCLTGLYLSTQYQNLRKQISDFREEIKVHILKEGTNDEELYRMVMDKSRNLLSEDHPANKVHISSEQ